VRARNLLRRSRYSLAGFAREAIFASGEAASKIPGIQLDSSPFFSRPERLFALAFGTEVRAGTHSRRLRRLPVQRSDQLSYRFNRELVITWNPQALSHLIKLDI